MPLPIIEAFWDDGSISWGDALRPHRKSVRSLLAAFDRQGRELVGESLFDGLVCALDRGNASLGGSFRTEIEQIADLAGTVPGVVIEATASVIKVAVTSDAKEAKVPDFIVNLKTPLAEKSIPASGFEFGLAAKGQAELDGTYDSYTQVPATATTAQSAQIVLREGTIIPAKKVVPVHKPTPAHKPAAH